MNAAVALLNYWASVWGDAMIRACCLGALAALAGWGITRAWPRMPPTAQSWVWRLVYLKMLLALVWATPLELPLLPPENSLVESANLQPAVAMPASATPKALRADVDSSSFDPILDAGTTAVVPTTALLLMLVWSIGFGVCLGALVRNWWAMRRLRAGCREVNGGTQDEQTTYSQARTANAGDVREVAAELCGHLGVKHVPKVLLTDAAITPQLVGSRWPAIVLPAQMLKVASPELVRTIVAHELAHCRRGDLLWNWLPTLTNALLWFHPATWLANREWRVAQEIACDETAIRVTRTRPDDYARRLVEFVESYSPGFRPSQFAVGVSQSFTDLSRRIVALRLFAPHSNFSTRSAALVVIAAAFVGLVPWKLTAQQNEQPSDQQNHQTATVAGTESTLAPQSADAPTGSAANSEEATPADGAERLAGRLFVNATVRLTDDQKPKEIKHNLIISVEPDTGAWTTLVTGGYSLRASRDGSLLAYKKITPRNGERGSDEDSIEELWVCEAKTGDKARRVAVIGGKPVWSPDGRDLAVTEGSAKKEGEKNAETSAWEAVTWKVSMDGKSKTRLPVPSTDFVEDWSPDGKWFVTSSDRHAPFGRGYQLYLMRPDGTDERRLTTGNGLNVYARFSPDGKQIAYVHQEHSANSIRTIDVETGRETVVFAPTGLTMVEMGCWSPNGLQLIALLRDWKLDETGDKMLEPENSNARFALIDLDGTQRRELRLQNADLHFVGHPDWR